MNNKFKDFFEKFVELLLVFFILLGVCLFINKGLVIKGLYMDDLYHWSWFRGLDIKEFAFKFYEGSSRYRPFFHAIQYIIYMIAGAEPTKFSLINKINNTFVALFIYYFATRLSAKRIIAFFVAALYLISHFAYYQIGQVIGTLETFALLFSTIILFFSLKLSGVMDRESIKSNVVSIIVLFVTYFVVVFTHERYLCLAPIIVLSLLFAKKSESKNIFTNYKFISFILFIIEIIAILYIRQLAIGKVLPAGTGGTRVENTFDIMTCIKQCFIQVAMIFGFNIGPEHLVGIEYSAIPSEKIKFFLLCSVVSVLVITIIYIVKRLKGIKVNNDRNYLAAEIIFMSFIALCIGASSVTIRVEMRFVYVSFVGALLFLSYINGAIFDIVGRKIYVTVFLILTMIFAVMRIPVELTYRNYFDKIYCMVDQNRMNSLYDNTIGTYGLSDVLNNKKIYIVGNLFNMTNFYNEYFFKIYDEKNVGSIINVINDVSELPPDATNENSIVLLEDYVNNAYTRYNIEK